MLTTWKKEDGKFTPLQRTSRNWSLDHNAAYVTLNFWQIGEKNKIEKTVSTRERIWITKILFNGYTKQGKFKK